MEVPKFMDLKFWVEPPLSLNSEELGSDLTLSFSSFPSSSDSLWREGTLLSLGSSSSHRPWHWKWRQRKKAGYCKVIFYARMKGIQTFHGTSQTITVAQSANRALHRVFFHLLRKQENCKKQMERNVVARFKLCAAGTHTSKSGQYWPFMPFIQYWISTSLCC